MSETTNLKLFKHDNPSTNENQFDIETSLNENWDKIDDAYGELNSNKVDKEEGKGLSTNDFTNELKTKLEGLEKYDDTEIKQDISDIQKKDEEQDTDIESLQSENTELKAENERLRKDIDNNIPTTNGNGENITLNETTESRFTKFEVTGNSKQETSTEGSNILNLNKPFLENKIYNNQGIEQSYDGSNTYSLKLENGVKYYISIAEGGSYYTKWKNNTFVSYEIKTAGLVEETRDDSFDEIRYSLFTNASNFETSYINKNTNTGYEDYTPDMPSTEFISEIKNVQNNANITVCNKNLGNADLLFKQMKEFNTNYVREETVDGKECIVFSNAKFLNTEGFKGLQKRYKENIRYLIRAKCRIYDESIISGRNLFIQAFNEKGKNIGYSSYGANGANWLQFSFLTNADETVEYITFSYGNPSYWCLDKSSLRIEEYEGSISEDFKANQEQNFTFQLQEGQKLYKTDYLADDGIHHKRKQVVIDGTENWFLGTELTNTHSFGFVKNDKKSGLGLCNTFITKSSGISSVDEEFVQVNASGNIIYIRINKDKLNSLNVAGIKEWLAKRYELGTPVIVEYELAEEEIESYTEEQQAVYDEIKKTVHSYKDVTHIFSTDETSLIFDVEAKRDINSVIAQINSALLERS